MGDTWQRPPGVPDDATWFPDAFEWRCGPVDAAGEKQGLHRSFRPDGTLREQVTFIDGKGVGTYLCFHPDGQIAGRGEFVDGQMQGTLRAFASDGPTPEVLQPCCVPPNAWELQSDFHHGQLMARRWYDRSGQQILESGAPHPPRPASVPPVARYDEASSRWLVGDYAVTRIGEGERVIVAAGPGTTVGGEVRVAMRPEQVQLSPAGTPSPDGGSCLRGRIAEVVFLGMYTQFHVDTRAGRVVSHRMADEPLAELEPGTDVVLEWQPEDAALV